MDAKINFTKQNFLKFTKLVLNEVSPYIKGLIIGFIITKLFIKHKIKYEITENNNPELYNSVQEIGRKMNLSKKIRIFITNDQKPNAFAYVLDINPSIYITEGALKLLTVDELKFVAGHEMGHLQDKYKILLSNVSFTIISNLLLDYFKNLFTKQNNKNNSNVLLSDKAIKTYFFLYNLLIENIRNLLSRHFEYRADRNGVKTTSDSKIAINTLTKLYNQLKQNKNWVIEIITRINRFLKGTTHPSLDKRIDAINKFDQNKESFILYNNKKLQNKIFYDV